MQHVFRRGNRDGARGNVGRGRSVYRETRGVAGRIKTGAGGGAGLVGRSIASSWFASLIPPDGGTHALHMTPITQTDGRHRTRAVPHP
mgnify:CR=1 FL=1